MRVAGLTEERFSIEVGASGRAKGRKRHEPWLRWANLGDVAGWYAIGTRDALPDDANDFWSRTFALGTAVGNGRVDAVHAVGPCGLSLGGLGVTAKSGLAASLLGECLEHEPAHWLKCMAPALMDSGMYPRKGDAYAWGWTFFDVRCYPRAEGQRWVLRDRWDWMFADSKPLARLWVQGCASMLRDRRFDAAQVKFLARVSPALLGNMRESLQFVGGDDAWLWSREQQGLWAVAIVLALADTKLATKVVMDAMAAATPRASAGVAHATLFALRNAVPSLASEGLPDRFVARVRRTLEVFPRYFIAMPECW